MENKWEIIIFVTIGILAIALGTLMILEIIKEFDKIIKYNKERLSRWQ